MHQPANRLKVAIPLLEGRHGVMIGVRGQLIALELFGSSIGLAARGEGIVAAAWLGARSLPPIAAPAEAGRAFARLLAGTALSDQSPAGAGRRALLNSA